MRFRLRHVLIGLISLAVAVTSVTSFLGMGEGSSDEPAEVVLEVKLHEFVLETPSRAENRAGEAIHVVEGREITLRARVEGVREFLVVATGCERCPNARALARPDSEGLVRLTLTLPEANTVYEVEGVAFIADKARYGWEGGYYDSRPAAPAPERYRVLATR